MNRMEESNALLQAKNIEEYLGTLKKNVFKEDTLKIFSFYSLQQKEEMRCVDAYGKDSLDSISYVIKGNKISIKSNAFLKKAIEEKNIEVLDAEKSSDGLEIFSFYQNIVIIPISLDKDIIGAFICSVDANKDKSRSIAKEIQKITEEAKTNLYILNQVELKNEEIKSNNSKIKFIEPIFEMFFSSITSEESALNIISKKLLQKTPFDIVSVSTLENDQLNCRLVTGNNGQNDNIINSWWKHQINNPQNINNNKDFSINSLIQGKPLYIQNFEKIDNNFLNQREKKWQERDLKIKTFLSIPIIANHNLIGSIDLLSFSSEVILTEEDINALNNLGHGFGLIYQQHILQKNIARYANQLNESRYYSRIKTVKPGDKEIFDSISGAYNKEYLKAVLKEITESKIKNHPVTIMEINIAKFNFINEKYGYNIGNQLLQILKKSIEKTVRSDIDYIFRYEADRFFMTLDHCTEKGISNLFNRINTVFSEDVYHIPILSSETIELNYGDCEYLTQNILQIETELKKSVKNNNINKEKINLLTSKTKQK